MTKGEQAKKLWKELEDIPFDYGEDGGLYLAEDWCVFSKGTERDDIWHWFEDTFKVSVASLLYEDETSGICNYAKEQQEIWLL